MKTYCFRCKGCGYKFHSDEHDLVTWCLECERYDTVVRDYRAESVAIDRSGLQ